MRSPRARACRGRRRSRRSASCSRLPLLCHLTSPCAAGTARRNECRRENPTPREHGGPKNVASPIDAQAGHPSADGATPLTMGQVYDEIDDRLARWIAAQALFFVGSAPLADDGHVNVSPKGPIGSLRVLGPTTVAYLDIVGSGAETIAHVRENGRIVVMLCAFAGPPRIVRLHGQAEAFTADTPGYEALREQAGFEAPSVPESARSIVRVEVSRVADSCGYGVPLMTTVGTRPHFDAWAGKKVRVGGPEALRNY